jgi:hypothetical protein
MGLLLAQVWASPLNRRLARRNGRIEFVILRMALSPPVALHPASWRRSYVRLQAGVGLPGEDLHLSGRLRLQAHGPEHRALAGLGRAQPSWSGAAFHQTVAFVRQGRGEKLRPRYFLRHRSSNSVIIFKVCEARGRSRQGQRTEEWMKNIQPVTPSASLIFRSFACMWRPSSSAPLAD